MANIFAHLQTTYFLYVQITIHQGIGYKGGISFQSTMSKTMSRCVGNVQNWLSNILDSFSHAI